MTYGSTSTATVIGCPVCDTEDEQIARSLEPGEKPPRKYVSEDERDAVMARIVSGEAYRDHVELLEERRAEIESAKSIGKVHRRRGNIQS